MTPEDEAAYKAKLEEAIRVGYEILKNGGSSLDAVEKTINVMEDSPLFNAGKGAVFTNADSNELDSSIMDGNCLNAGASAGTTNVRNPINLARAIMEKSPHVMLSGKGAEEFAKEQGIQIVDPSYFFTERRYNSLLKIKETEKKLFSLIKILSENKKTIPENPTKIPIDLIKLIFSLLIKKWAKIAAVKGVLAINIAAKLLWTFWIP